jgi:hypothetical protein
MIALPAREGPLWPGFAIEIHCWLRLRILVKGVRKNAGTRALAGVCLKQQFVFPLAFSIPGFAPDEHLSGTQPHDRSRMSPFNRTDVKNHLRPPFLLGTRLVRPEGQSDATGFFAVEPDTIERNLSSFADDFVAEHSLSRAAVAPVDPVTALARRQVRTASKSAQQ